MSEQEDILKMALLVGGGIREIQKSTVEGSEFVSGNLPNPVEFVKSIAQTDLRGEIARSKANSPGGIQDPSKTPEKSDSTASLGETESLKKIVELLTEIKDILLKRG